MGRGGRHRRRVSRCDGVAVVMDQVVKTCGLGGVQREGGAGMAGTAG